MQITLYVPERVQEALKEKAKKEDRSVSYMATHILEKGLNMGASSVDEVEKIEKKKKKKRTKRIKK